MWSAAPSRIPVQFHQFAGRAETQAAVTSRDLEGAWSLELIWGGGPREQLWLEPGCCTPGGRRIEGNPRQGTTHLVRVTLSARLAQV